MAHALGLDMRVDEFEHSNMFQLPLQQRAVVMHCQLQCNDFRAGSEDPNMLSIEQ